MDFLIRRAEGRTFVSVRGVVAIPKRMVGQCSENFD